MAAFVAARCAPEWRVRYQRLLDHGRSKKEAFTILPRALLRVIYHLLRTGQTYDPTLLTPPTVAGDGWWTTRYELFLMPARQARVALAHTIPREILGSEAYVFDPSRFTAVTIPVLLLLGGNSPPFLKAATERMHASLPTSRIAVLPGQQHIAKSTAPELFLREVVAFLLQEE
jgi:pimeloyl-ACP methyl ester carboxylesterase